MKKEEKKEKNTLERENTRLKIFIIIFMAITICLGTFYFNVICLGAGCEHKIPRPLVIINPVRNNINSEEKNATANEVSSNYSYEDIYAVYNSPENSGKEYWLTLHKDGKFGGKFDNKTGEGTYTLEGNKVILNYTSEMVSGEEKEITRRKELDIVDKTTLYDPENDLNLNRTNIPTETPE